MKPEALSNRYSGDIKCEVTSATNWYHVSYVDEALVAAVSGNNAINLVRELPLND